MSGEGVHQTDLPFLILRTLSSVMKGRLNSKATAPSANATRLPRGEEGEPEVARTERRAGRELNEPVQLRSEGDGRSDGSGGGDGLL